MPVIRRAILSTLTEIPRTVITKHLGAIHVLGDIRRLPDELDLMCREHKGNAIINLRYYPVYGYLLAVGDAVVVKRSLTGFVEPRGTSYGMPARYRFQGNRRDPRIPDL
jgi:hypothetical protein